MHLPAERSDNEGSIWRVGVERDGVSPPAGPGQICRADPDHRRIRGRIDRHQRHQLHRWRRLCPRDADCADRDKRSGRYPSDQSADPRAADHGGFPRLDRRHDRRPSLSRYRQWRQRGLQHRPQAGEPRQDGGLHHLRAGSDRHRRGRIRRPGHSVCAGITRQCASGSRLHSVPKGPGPCISVDGSSMA